jgi:hypothetical protein
MTDEAIGFLRRNQKSRFFLYVPYTAPHSPFQGPDDLQANPLPLDSVLWNQSNGRPKINALRVDPHVVWSRDYTKVCFNGASEGIRQIYVADLSEVVGI